MSSNQSGGRSLTHQEKLLGEFCVAFRLGKKLCSPVLHTTEYCRVKGISTPTFNIVSDRRGKSAQDCF
jgi:hypothetical protein